ncbi:diaminopropionate ammonia-lyase [Clostridium estertheticum]|uniref:diaminopropionate ammonia-lyase n=1 Tax=Clostridium estertheticum TaxID=238834 RepID=UPI001CF4CE91|nr:diaminopropionate ammonia-lyase [Clostridium estertheticum]MCB2307415.1 diaminopropionate ammonia-lyase [Clostridium estertheticum]MCB2345672.1 diaminopropionate ammonia-lyase [Clostridium estertheticum]MCB2350904.1 diaminopropionate ammonia-lyase [Clostridium estertheticum]WAG44111.1 diaminopropionate ammonia-lyase [Clostridium estertheticum]
MRDIEAIKYITNEDARKAYNKKTSVEFIDKEVVKKVRNFHKSFSEYKITPIRSLKELSKELGVSNIWVKDESYRFGLNAFKVLGGSYAVGKYLADKLNMDISELSFEKLRSKEIKEKLGDITFVTATDGNHGRGIAWAANQLGQKSVVFMPKGSSEVRLNNIRKEGAEASITDLNYDDAVRLANKYADEHNGVMVQDSAWEGYTDIPTWIMQGYATLIDEAIEQIKEEGDILTHVFLQVGVGSFAGSIQGYLAAEFGADRPITTIVEPNEAACIFNSIKEKDGKPHAVTGYMPTIMAGLACGEPNIVSFGILRDYADMYISCPDYVTARGMRILGNPLKEDPKVISGESGAVCLGMVSLILGDDNLKEIAGKLKLNKDSKILVISTEGDTDPISYKNIVWDGAYASL